MCAATAGTVDALLPLSLLEAVRAVDRPVVEPETEFVAELRNKRLGLSDTVHAQIGRYADAVRRSHRPTFDEVSALARLIGRRPDADTVFRAAGNLFAEHAYATVLAMTRAVVRKLPGIVARPLALRHVRRIVRRYFAGTVERHGTSLMFDVPRPVTSRSGAPSGGCAYYEAGLRELLRLLVGSEGTAEHVRCAERDEGLCQWRAEWWRVGGGAGRPA